MRRPALHCMVLRNVLHGRQNCKPSPAGDARNNEFGFTPFWKATLSPIERPAEAAVVATASGSCPTRNSIPQLTWQSSDTTPALRFHPAPDSCNHRHRRPRSNDIPGPIAPAAASNRNRPVLRAAECLARPRRSGHDRHSRTQCWLPEFRPDKSFLPLAARSAVAVIGGFRADRRKINCQIARRVGPRAATAPHIYCFENGLSRVCWWKLQIWLSVYCGLWPANRGAACKTCPDAPWHQVQLRTAARHLPAPERLRRQSPVSLLLTRCAS